jgi:hypothetical protein
MIADQVDPTVAIVAAVLGTGGVELSGALACSMAVLAYHKRDYKIMTVSIMAAIIYAVFVMVGILQARNTATFAGAVIISLVAYLMQGVWQSYNNKLRTEQAETDMQIAQMDAERKLVNAQARREKASTGRQSGKQSTQFAADEELIKLIQMYWAQYPDASYRDAARACGCAPSTAGKYRPQEATK